VVDADRIAGETLVTLGEVAERFRSPRTRKRLDVGTVRRWSRKGVAGVRLGTVLIGGTRYTSEEELTRWRRQVALAREPVRLAPGPAPAAARREHAQAKARNDARFGTT
jgi:hypothetical protein